MKTLIDENEIASQIEKKIIDNILAAIATRLHYEHHLATRAALNVVVDSILDSKLEGIKK